MPLPQIDSISAMMIVWRLGGKLLRTVLCCVVYVYVRREHLCSHRKPYSLDCYGGALERL